MFGRWNRSLLYRMRPVVSLEEFVASPWSKSHRDYENAVFNVRPAPEFSTGEVLVASLYRACGYEGCSETDVPRAGREFDKTTRSTKKLNNEPGRIKLDTWRTVVHGVLESPKQPNQSSKRFLQLCPVIPDVSLYSGSARLAGSSWNPGALVQRMIYLGASSAAAAEELWARLHHTLAVSASDDLWARWLADEFSHRVKGAREWQPVPFPRQEREFLEEDRQSIKSPAQQFFRDIDSVILAKNKMTRRQWISVLESILRLGCATHVLWLCDVNARIWRRASAVLSGTSPVPTLEEVRSQLVMADRRYLAYGNPAIADIKQYASDYPGLATRPQRSPVGISSREVTFGAIGFLRWDPIIHCRY